MRFLLSHRHPAHECAVAFAAWRGFDSPLRHTVATASCAVESSPTGAHRIWWAVHAESEEEALRQLPAWIAERSKVRRVKEVTIP